MGRDRDARNGRQKRLQLTPRGLKVLRMGEKIFDELRAQWAEQIGMDKLQLIESVLAERVEAGSNVRSDEL